MQSKMFDFEIDGKGPACLYGDLSSLKPLMLNGVAHAFRNGSNVVLTLYSETGISANGSFICSGDARVGLDSASLKTIISQLIAIDEAFFPTKNELLQDRLTTSNTEAKKRDETLGPPL